MSYTVEKISGNKVKLTFVESAEAFDAAMQKAYLKNRGKINVPGFRKGKAPRKLIENMYGESVFYDDAFEIVAQPAYDEALKADAIAAVDRPEVDIQQIGAGQELKFTIEVFVKPDITLGEYKGVAVEKNVQPVTEEAINARIDSDVERASTTQDVTDRPVQAQDTVNLDYAGSVDGVPFEGGTAQGQTLVIGSNTFFNPESKHTCSAFASSSTLISVPLMLISPSTASPLTAGLRSAMELIAISVGKANLSVIPMPCRS